MPLVKHSLLQQLQRIRALQNAKSAQANSLIYSTLPTISAKTTYPPTPTLFCDVYANKALTAICGRCVCK
jgi:hypothetical protein